MMWIEILSRHRDITSRLRMPGPEVRIGRGYDNDIVVDDPYVAAQHVRIFRDEAGRLVAEDLGTANGTFLDGGKSPLARIVLDGTQPIRIGHTYVRVREPNHMVERERVARAALPTLPIIVAVALGALAIGVELLRVWLTQTSEPKLSAYLSPPVYLATAIFVWVGAWSLLARIFSGRSHFLRNLLIALAGTLVFSLYDELAQLAAFAWTWSAARNYQYAVTWVILAAVVILHLREISPSRLVLKGALVTIAFAAVVAVQTLQQSEALSDTGRQNTARRLMPPAFRLAPVRDEGAFFADLARLRAKLDGDRAKGIADEAR
jgi:pSer/pThr/pTyr-binding forkhead associated (FHA) protein